MAAGSGGGPIAKPVLDRGVAPESDPGAPDARTVVECTATFPGGGSGACSARWYQSGRLEFYRHNTFHNLVMSNAFSWIRWYDSYGRLIFHYECRTGVAANDLPLHADCPDPWNRGEYYIGVQTLVVYGEQGFCPLSSCILHGRLQIDHV